ncbi:hypothetical protein CAPTEDRAFT_189386 [Capitella teleta]|uniref:THAP-type domain-containing protein n=1 Tax=Capitella teleta TaxID=283909 RepID=R7UL01_CAPTE|nr:hypothetical protein CAPTEDRAFT_189386 [Capitella teleta]|eukprot:ELU06788.1 hypothetical protein CAPTEDRAFT_189386 [Capitella teleta]
MPNHHCVVKDCNADTQKPVSKWPFMAGVTFIPLPSKADRPAHRSCWLSRIKHEKGFRPTYNERVCSRHFVDGRPTAAHPYPTLFPHNNYGMCNKERALNSLQKAREGMNHSYEEGLTEEMDYFILDVTENQAPEKKESTDDYPPDILLDHGYCHPSSIDPHVVGDEPMEDEDSTSTRGRIHINATPKSTQMIEKTTRETGLDALNDGYEDLLQQNQHSRDGGALAEGAEIIVLQGTLRFCGWSLHQVADHFDISDGLASNIFVTYINILDTILQPLRLWPDRDAIDQKSCCLKHETS